MPEEGVEIVNMRTAPVDEIVASLPKAAPEKDGRTAIQPQEKGDWIPWFPVIDYDRCESCRRCFDFMLTATPPSRIIGDQACDNDALDARLAEQGVEPIAPHRDNRKPENVTQDRRPLRRIARHWTVERTTS